MPKFIDGKTKRKVLLEVAKRETTIKDIANKYKISTATLFNIRRDNIELYKKIILDLQNTVRDRALLTADKAIKNIKNDKLKQSTGLQLSQIASNLNGIYTDKQANNMSVTINIPKDRQSLEAMILGDDVIIDTANDKTDHGGN
jgi:hypothetical protein